MDSENTNSTNQQNLGSENISEHIFNAFADDIFDSICETTFTDNFKNNFVDAVHENALSETNFYEYYSEQFSYDLFKTVFLELVFIQRFWKL